MPPSLQIVSVSSFDRAFTTETPTPWSPPETLYELSSNFPPEWRVVRINSAADIPSFL